VDTGKDGAFNTNGKNWFENFEKVEISEGLEEKKT